MARVAACRALIMFLVSIAFSINGKHPIHQSMHVEVSGPNRSSSTTTASTRVKSSSPGLPLINNTMTYFGANQISAAAGAARPQQPLLGVLLGVVLLAFTRALY
ncbi:hypothetical protein EJB05_55429, partial [Eragrostis curvula]